MYSSTEVSQSLLLLLVKDFQNLLVRGQKGDSLIFNGLETRARPNNQKEQKLPKQYYNISHRTLHRRLNNFGT